MKTREKRFLFNQIFFYSIMHEIKKQKIEIKMLFYYFYYYLPSGVFKKKHPIQKFYQ